MKKSAIILTSIMLLSMAVGSANAQNLKVKYQGDVQVGYSIGIGTFPADRFNLHMVNGVRFNEYFSAGLGLGLDLYAANNFEYDKPELVLPIYLNTKGYLPVADKTSLFLSLDLGCGIGITEGVTGMSGFMFTPSVGASFKVSDKNAITVGLGYNYQTWSAGGIFDINTDAIQLKVGFTF